MVGFYDPIDTADQERIEQMLHQGGIEYFLKRETELGSSQILIAEEDVAEAEKLLALTRH